jgi:hypothetical protein
MFVVVGGCAQPSLRVGQWIGPTDPAQESIQHLPDDPTARLLTTPHYQIYSTIDDEELLDKLGELMEGSLYAYHTLAPEVSLTGKPMTCYIFSQRSQWAEFTYEHTGGAAPLYLQINRGGYTVGDWYVAYYIGDSSTLAVSAHEGWHQFCARYFAARLPPFMEEGFATMFEGVRFRNGLPVFNLSINEDRAIALRTTIDHGELLPLDALVGMNAGQVISRPGAEISAFYAEAWGFTRFLWDGDGGAHRPALAKILADCANGDIYDPTGPPHRWIRGWTARGAKAMLEHYLGMSFDQIDDAYSRYIRSVADDELPYETFEPW